MDFCALIAYYVGVLPIFIIGACLFGSVSGSFMSLAIDGNILPHAAILAPMSGVTDWPFRRAVRRCGGGLVVTEMIASAAVLRDVKSEMRKLQTEAIAEAPLSIQLAGWDPPVMAEAAKICADLGASFIDINMGCPVKKVTGKLSGSKSSCPKSSCPKGLAWREANLLVLAARTPDPAATIIAAHELLPD